MNFFQNLVAKNQIRVLSLQASNSFSQSFFVDKKQIIYRKSTKNNMQSKDFKTVSLLLIYLKKLNTKHKKEQIKLQRQRKL